MKTKLLLIITIAICEIANAQYTNLHEFTGNPDGSQPLGSLISDGTFLYGMTLHGGTYTNSLGTIFKIKSDGTGYVKLHDFNSTNGRSPMGSLIFDGTFLYGMTNAGGIGSSCGISGCGVIFKIMPNGTGYSDLLNFTGVANGRSPSYGSLFSDGTFLYGMTTNGGTGTCTGGCGVLFKIKADGTGDTILLNFTGLTNGTYPQGSLISDGIFLYGMTAQGGTNDYGTIFKIKPDGTGYFKLLDFASTGTANGYSPFGSLISVGTFLYGMTNGGGSNNQGTIFKIMPDGTGYSKLLDFDLQSGPNGSAPMGTLITDGAFLYGVTKYGGINGKGTIFKIKPDGTEYSKVFDFAGIANGSSPSGNLISDGMFLYGMTEQGGANNIGTIFKYMDSTKITTSIALDNMTTDFNVYPNPFTSQTTITFNNEQKNTTIKIMDLVGKEIETLNVTGKQVIIEKGKMKAGLHYIQVIDGFKNVVNRKIIVL